MNKQILGLKKLTPPFFELIVLQYSVSFSIIRYYMIRRSIIVLEYETRERLKQVGHKQETYDQIIQQLLKLKEEGGISEH